MKISGHNKAFTLVELLIASAISLVVMITIVSAFRTGIFGYRDIEDSLVTEQGAAQVLDRIRMDLKNSITYSKDQSAFSGEGDAMSFLTVADVYQDGVWRTELTTVTYRWDGQRLLRSSKMGKAALDVRSAASPQDVTIPGGKFILSYGTWNSVGDQMVFTDHWDPLKGVPNAVKINLSYNSVPFEQFVALPVAK